VVIQRLFATGLGLQTLSRLTRRDDVRERLGLAIDELDTTIRDIRTAIFELHAPPATSLRATLIDTVNAAGESLGFRPRLDITGPIDRAVAEAVKSCLVAVLVEALSNVVRHAEAHAVTVHIAVANDTLTLRVCDDGRGMQRLGSGNRLANGNGLANMRRRAEAHGGTFDIAVVEPHGTALTWIVQLDR
jgi:signal transduction histidine kinase